MKVGSLGKKICKSRHILEQIVTSVNIGLSRYFLEKVGISVKVAKSWYILEKGRYIRKTRYK